MAGGAGGMGGMGAGLGGNMGEGMGGMGGGMGGMGGGMGGGFGGNAAPALGDPPAVAGAPRPQNVANGGENGAEQFSVKAFRHHMPAKIALQPGDPGRPYLAALRAAPAGQAYEVYMKHRARYARSPDFFIDCADFFFERHETPLANRVLSNLAELHGNDAALLRLLAYRLLQAGAYDPAVETFEEILSSRPNEPRSYRDLALALAQRADAARPKPKGHAIMRVDDQQKTAIRSDYNRAADCLTEIVMRNWDGQPRDIDLPVLMERNRIVFESKAFGIKPKVVDHRLAKLLDLDLRIVVSPIDDVRLNLVITEPSGEKASSTNPSTKIGGLMSRPIQGTLQVALQGTGQCDCPVEYLVRRALNGQYKIEANCTTPGGTPAAAMVRVDIFTNFGRPSEEHSSMTVRINESPDLVSLGQVKF